jgi:hypothetical protein
MSLCAGFRRPIKRDPDRGGRGSRIAPPQACHHVERLNISRPSGISFSPKPALPSPAHTPHRRANFRRPLRRTPDRGGCGFSIAPPQACPCTERLNISRPSGISFSSKPAHASLPPTPHSLADLCRPLRFHTFSSFSFSFSCPSCPGVSRPHRHCHAS